MAFTLQVPEWLNRRKKETDHRSEEKELAPLSYPRDKGERFGREQIQILFQLGVSNILQGVGEIPITVQAKLENVLATRESNAFEQFLDRLTPHARVLLLLLFFSFLTGTSDITAAQDSAVAQTDDSQLENEYSTSGWEKYSAGQVGYARAKLTTEPIKMYTSPDEGATEIQNDTLEVHRLIPRRIPVRYEISPYSIFRFQAVGNGWAKILPDNGVYSPFGDGKEDVFVHVSDFEPVENLEPLSVNPETKPEDKQIVVVRGQEPELLLLEGNNIVMHVPVVLGGAYETTNTPIGDHRISLVRASRDMPGYPGVGFSMYFSGAKGYALHDSYWWNWDQLDKGFYGSSGCINLPNFKWGTATVDGEQVPVPEFIYRWVSTNIDYNESDPTQEEAHTDWQDPGYYDGKTAVRLLIVHSIDGLYQYHGQGSAQKWDQVIGGYRDLNGKWILPNMATTTLYSVPQILDNGLRSKIYE